MTNDELRGGDSSRRRLLVQGKGGDLDLLTLGLTLPFRVELRSSPDRAGR